MNILIAEDDPVSRESLASILQGFQHQVRAYEDGVGAWEALREPDAPLLAILDWMMPGMTGVDVCRHVRSMRQVPRPYLFLLTSRSLKTDIAAGLEAGADDYLTKPYSLDELRARINVGLRMLELQQQLTTTIKDLRAAVNEVRTLREILPICCVCKKIRDDNDCWRRLEDYFNSYSGLRFSHGICPSCKAEHYPELTE